MMRDDKGCYDDNYIIPYDLTSSIQISNPHSNQEMRNRLEQSITIHVHTHTASGGSQCFLIKN